MQYMLHVFAICCRFLPYMVYFLASYSFRDSWGLFTEISCILRERERERYLARWVTSGVGISSEICCMGHQAGMSSQSFCHMLQVLPTYSMLSPYAMFSPYAEFDYMQYMLNCFATCCRFFPSMVYLSTSKIAIAALSNFAFAMMLCVYNWVTKVCSLH